MIVDAWSDGGAALNAEVTKIAWSTDGGATWKKNTVPTNGRSFYTAPALAPDGSKVYLSNTAFVTPFQPTTAAPRLLVNGFYSAPMSAAGPGAWTTEVLGMAGDSRAGSANGLRSEFLGDYDYASASRSYGVGIWTADARDAADCPAIDTYRQSLYTASPLPKPNPATACPGSFGHIEIRGATTG